MIALLWNNVITHAISALYRCHILRHDCTVLRSRQHSNRIFRHNKRSDKYVVGTNVTKCIRSHSAHISTIRKDRINTVTIIGDDIDCDILSVGCLCDRGGHDATGTCRGRHLKIIDGELRHNRMISMHICKRIAACNSHRNVIHQQAADMPARLGDN